MINKLNKQSQNRLCVIDGCDSKAKDVIMAHAIQKSRILKKLAVNNEVLIQNFKNKPTVLAIENGVEEPFYFLEEVNIKKATVHTCFCGKHDDQLFQKIEKASYSFDDMTEEQKFLFAFRAFAFEYYKDITVKKFYKLMCKEFPEIFRKPSFVYKYRHAMIKVDELDYYHKQFNEGINDQDFTKLNTFVLKINHKVGVSGYMSIAPPFDVKGRRVKGLIGIKKQMRRIFITIVPDDKSSYVLISCLKADLTVYEDYFNALVESDEELILHYLNMFLPLYSENLVISPTLFNSFTEQGQGMLQYFVSEMSNWRISKQISTLQVVLERINKQNIKLRPIDQNPYNLFGEID
tara:strand:+ start:229 stop:1275 length:1047 start_codon:yes stop_codon:yes gene_type:complete